jgi:hypothetical protein
MRTKLFYCLGPRTRLPTRIPPEVIYYTSGVMGVVLGAPIIHEFWCRMRTSWGNEKTLKIKKYYN